MQAKSPCFALRGDLVTARQAQPSQVPSHIGLVFEWHKGTRRALRKAFFFNFQSESLHFSPFQLWEVPGISGPLPSHLLLWITEGTGIRAVGGDVY